MNQILSPPRPDSWHSFTLRLCHSEWLMDAKVFAWPRSLSPPSSFVVNSVLRHDFVTRPPSTPTNCSVSQTLNPCIAKRRRTRDGDKDEAERTVLMSWRSSSSSAPLPRNPGTPSFRLRQLNSAEPDDEQNSIKSCGSDSCLCHVNKLNSVSHGRRSGQSTSGPLPSIRSPN